MVTKKNGRKWLGLNEITHIILRDYYKVRRYPNKTFDYAIDISSNIGVFSLMAAVIWPSTKVVAYEPDTEFFGYTQDNLRGFYNVVCNNAALSDGGPQYYTDVQGFLTTKPNTRPVPGVKLSGILSDNNITQAHSYMLKIDCEGGERFIVGDRDDEDALRGARYIGIEMHFQCPNNRCYDDFPKYEQYDEWIHDTLGRTHTIEYGKSRRNKGIGTYWASKTTISAAQAAQ